MTKDHGYWLFWALYGGLALQTDTGWWQLAGGILMVIALIIYKKTPEDTVWTRRGTPEPTAFLIHKGITYVTYDPMARISYPFSAEDRPVDSRQDDDDAS